MVTFESREAETFQVQDTDGYRHTVRKIPARTASDRPDWMFIVGASELTAQDDKESLFADAHGNSYTRLC